MARSRSAYFILLIVAIVLALMALIYLSPIGNMVVVLLFLSIIGIPIVYLLALIPPLAMLAVLATVFAFPFRRLGWVVVPLAFIPAAATMVVAPTVLNRSADHEAQLLSGADVNKEPAPFRGQTLAIFVKPKHDLECLDFCQRALVSGAVKTFIVAKSEETWPEIDYSAEGMAYWLERRGACDEVKIRQGVIDYPVLLQAESPAPALRLLIANGSCLVSHKRPVSDADAILLHAEMVEKRTERHSLNPLYVPMQALRLSWHVRDGDKIVEKHRQTAVKYAVLRTPLFPGLQPGAELRMHAGLNREERKLGPDRADVSLDAFLADRLKINLWFDPVATKKLRVSTIDSAMRQSTDLTQSQQSMIGDVFGELRSDNKNADVATLEKAVTLLSDPRVEVPDTLNGLVIAAYKSEPQLREKALAAYFDRLDLALLKVPSHEMRARSARLQRIAAAARSIPDKDFANRWPRFRSVLADPEAVSIFGTQILQANLAGTAAQADMLMLVDVASPLTGDNQRSNKHLHGNRFLAMGAICRMGPGAANLLPQLEARIRSGVIPLTQYNEIKLAAHTLRELGGDPELVRKFARPGKNAKDFEKQLEDALAHMHKRKGCF